ASLVRTRSWVQIPAAALGSVAQSSGVMEDVCSGWPRPLAEPSEMDLAGGWGLVLYSRRKLDLGNAEKALNTWPRKHSPERSRTSTWGRSGTLTTARPR